MVKIESPTETSMPSMIAKVRGIFKVTQEPSPSSLDSRTVPPTAFTFFLTTSIPTPLPEYSVTVSLVEKPGSIRRFKISCRL